MKQITENQAKIQRALIGLGIENSIAVVDEWRIVLSERGKCTNVESAIDLLRECVHLADEEGSPIVRPSESGPWIGKILKSRKEKEEDAKPKPTSSKNLSEIAEAAQYADMHNPDRVARFSASFDLLVSLEKQNGTFETDTVDGVFHANRRRFAGQDLIDRRIRDCSERYVSCRIETLRKTIEAKNMANTLDRKTSPDALGRP
jgi:hypothetical protein